MDDILNGRVTGLTGDVFSSCTSRPNTALLSTLLCFGCFTVAMALRKFRGSTFLNSGARRLIGDFGVPIAILMFVLIDYFIKDVYTEKLAVPNALEADMLEPTDKVFIAFFFHPIFL